MKNFYFLNITRIFILLFSFIVTPMHLFAQAPTIPSKNLSISAVDGDRFNINFTKGNGTRRIVIAKANSPVTAIPVNGIDYSAAAFGAGNEIAPGEFVVYRGYDSYTFIMGLAHSSSYHFKIFEFNGSYNSTYYLTSSYLEGNQTTKTYPTTQPSNITFSEVLGSSMKVNWTNGDGIGRILIVRANNPVDVEPQSLDNYTSNQGGFGNSSYEIGTGNYILYIGSGSPGVKITNLDPNTTYHFALFEYNGFYGRVYLTSNSPTNPAPGATASQITESYPTVNASGLDFDYIEGNRFSYYMNYYASNQTGNGQKRMIIAKQGSPVTAVPVDGIEYTSDSTFGNGDEIATGEFVIYSGSGYIGTKLFGLQPNSTYYLKVFEFNGSGANTYYLTTNDSNGDPVLEANQTTLGYPTIQASNITFSDISFNEMEVSWTNGDGSGSILIARANGPVDVEPQDFENYNSYGGGIGDPNHEIGAGNYVVAQGTWPSATINNLELGITYHFALFEYNGNNGKVYLTSTSPINPTPGATASQVTSTDNSPTINASSLFFNSIEGNSLNYYMTYYFDSFGNGEKRVIVAKEGSPVTADPVDGIEYTGIETFGYGDAIAPGEFVVYSGSDSYLDRYFYGLQPNTTYYFKVFEYNGSGTQANYLTTDDSYGDPVLEVSQATLGYPTTQASNITFSDIDFNEMKVSWTNGDGSGRILIARANEPVDVEPQDFEFYDGSPWGYGDGYYHLKLCQESWRKKWRHRIR